MRSAKRIISAKAFIQAWRTAKNVQSITRNAGKQDPNTFRVSWLWGGTNTFRVSWLWGGTNTFRVS